MIQEFSAGGIIYKKEDGQTLWLVRKPKGNPGYQGNLGWTLPKGWIDEGETVEQAALRETAEEAGIKARIISPLPVLKIFYTNKEGEKVAKSINYFVMEWLEDLKEGFGEETSEVRWVGPAEAVDLLVHQNERDLLEKSLVIIK